MGSSHDDPQRPRRDADERSYEDLDEPALEVPLLGALAEVYPGFELLDSDLEFERPHRVQYVALDGTGRLTLVLRVRGEGHSALLRALDARDFARRHLAPLLKHVAARRARPELAPRVVLVAADYEERLRRRLENLAECGVEAFELRRLRSHSGELVFLAPIAGAQMPAVAPVPSLDELLASLPEARRGEVEGLLERMQRLDRGLEVERRARGLAWRLGEDVLAELAFDGQGGAELAVAGKATRPWRNGRDAEEFLEDAVSGYLERAGHGPDAPTERRAATPDLGPLAALATAPVAAPAAAPLGGPLAAPSGAPVRTERRRDDADLYGD